MLAGVDACVDVVLLCRARHSRPGWALFLRLLLGVGYLAVFVAYAGFGRVFPPGYAYWGLSAGFAGPVVYLFLWLLGVWNLLNIALHRRRIGRDVRVCVARLGGLRRRRPARPSSSMAFVPERGRVNIRTGSRRFWDRGPAAGAAARVTDVETAELAPPVVPSVETHTEHHKVDGEAPSAEEQTVHQKSESISPTASARSGRASPPPAPPR